MKHIKPVVIAVAMLLAARAEALAEKNGCTFAAAADGGSVTVTSGARLVARLADAPRTRVTLSIDDAAGNHSELVWDPAVDDGLQHTLLLQGAAGGRIWTFTPSSEQERIQTGQVVVIISTSFVGELSGPAASLTDSLTLKGSRSAMTATVSTVTPSTKVAGSPRIILSCELGEVEMSSLKLDSRRVEMAANARGLLDQAVPAPVAEALTLLAEVAIDHAKAGAMKLVKQKFVEPMCSKLTLNALALRGSGPAFPRACSLLEQLRLEDVLSSGASIVTAAKDDIRLTIAPALLDAVIANDETRELAKIALQFANRLIDGESDSVVDVDLLVAFLDRLAWSNGFEQSQDVVLGWLQNLKLDANAQKALVRSTLNRALPSTFWDDPRSPLLVFANCKRKYRDVTSWMPDKDGQFPVGEYLTPDRRACLESLLATLFDATKFGDVEASVRAALKARYFRLDDLVKELRGRAPVRLASYLAATYGKGGASKLSPYLEQSAEPVLENACAVRLIVGITKWCSGRETCSAGDVAYAIDNPRRIFKPSNELPEALCWTGSAPDEKYRLPESTAQFIDLGVRMISFLRPAAKGDERTRALAMVRWLFSVVRTVNTEPLVDRLEQIAGQLIEGDYLRAMTESFSVAREVCRRTTCADWEPAKRALALVGAVASYVRTYEQTKSLDAAAARDARRKAIASLIDSATDREGRETNVVYSLGAPVGFSAGVRLSAGDDASYGSRLGAYDAAAGLQLRVPLAIAVQWLPKDDDDLFGSHLALWVADLGQFTRTRPPGSTDEISWKDFVGIGAQAGFLLGSKSHSLVLAAEASYAPGLYARDVMLVENGQTTVRNVSGVFTFGVTLAYYVPFFDLN